MKHDHSFLLSILALCALGALFLILPLSPSKESVVESTELFAPHAPKLPQDSQQIEVTFVGDMMFDRAVRNTVSKNGYDYVFGDSSAIFKGSDLVIGNLEGPITTFPSKTLLPNGSQTDLLIFTFPTSTALALKDHGIDVVSLANNHEGNFGSVGISQTKEYLNAAGIQYFGDPANAIDIATTTCRNNICLGIIGFHEFSHENQEKIIEKIHELKPLVDYVVVFPHWGDEYNTNYVSRQQVLAHKWIDEGADIIIGAHPHVIESIETYKNKPIFYSLGNYIFDQYFSFETTHGLTAHITFPKDKTKDISYTLLPITNTGIHVSIPDASTTEQILKSIKRF